ncbi:DNA polymerase III subunit delta [Patescibacteria group bacterium]|nr:DNA polymerase III subunit delta [Patescibacteria group bacterium]
MLIFLYGEDNYRSRQKLNKLKANFLAKDSSGINLQELDGRQVELAELKNAVQATPFMGEKRLIIVENILGGKNKSLLAGIADLLSQGLPESSVVVFWEAGVPDKRAKLFKLLAKQGQAEEVTLLIGQALNKWIAAEVVSRGGKIAADTASKLAAYVGNDLWQMAQEIDKLVTYKKGVEITAEDIDELVKAKLDTNIFNFVDALGRKDRENALKLLHDQLSSGEHALYLLSMITYQFRNLLIVKELLENGSNQRSIAKEAKMHPFVAQKTAQQASNYSSAGLKMIYRKLLDLDEAIKTSKIEPQLGLDLLVVGLCG